MRASESGRGVSCPASLVLLKTVRAPHEKRDRAAAFGTLCHWWCETGETDPEWADPKDIKCLEKKILLSGIDRDEWWEPGKGHHEVTFALRLHDGELLTPPAGMNRDDWKAGFPSNGYLTGTIDWLATHYGGAIVDDLKTGRWPVDPATSLQLRSYALVPWVRAGRPMEWDGVVSVTQWERYPLDGLPRRTFHSLSALDLAEHLGDLQHAVAHPGELNPNDDNCRFCDCKQTCPAWVGEDEDIYREQST